MEKYNELFNYLSDKENKIIEILKQHRIMALLKPNDILAGVSSYVFRPAKRLRPAVLLLSCGSVSPELDEERALSAAAAIELFHTWTLVHDDLIDNDNMRRSGPTVHFEMANNGKLKLNLNEQDALDYGRDIAILAGDMQHSWSISLLTDLVNKNLVDPHVIIKLISILETNVCSDLIYGETLDVQFSFASKNITEFLKSTDDDVINMLWLKTGALYAFSALAGAMIGKNSTDENDLELISLQKFAGNCGIAFQLQDDILGITGNESQLGKPIGSDIREGKKTTIILESFRNASLEQKEFLTNVLGNKKASHEQINNAILLLKELNGIEYTMKLACAYVEKAIPYLDELKESKYKDMLLQWAGYMIDRQL